MPLPKSVADLIEAFANNEADYTRPDFKEAQLRQQFLNPLFNTLGWDTANTAGYAEAYKEVVHEDAIKIGGETKAPDYSFRIGGQRKFFVEAKKPSVNIKDDPAPAYQLRRYSWTAKLPLGILTDFQEISIYDTRIRPHANDKASTARLFHWRYTDLHAKWDEFAGLFSKDAILKGAFDKYASAKRGKHGTTTFDDDFLADMEKWRELLARNIALRNPDLDQRSLNFSVQRILDRIIFLRIAEDRGIEPFGQLQALTPAAARNIGIVEEPPAPYGGTRRPTIYPRLCKIFERADFRYNSGLFHFENEKGRDELPDALTLKLDIDDAPLAHFISELYYPQSPYAFAIIPADILGSIYERFLGKTIRLTDGHRAVVEEKPEVRKAGGVYYTPAHIVEYIVRQTLDPLLENKTPRQAEKLKILDPACGSGSFLIGAYQHLLDWHLRYYIANDPRKHARQKNPPIYETSPNAHGIGKGNDHWLLTTAERKRILLNNIHGVDIDTQAVEVTKLSLLLKVLEGESRELQGRQMEFHRVLPDLGKNIQCGNSLIGHDFYQQLALPNLTDDDKYRLNTFEWRDGFPEIMRNGGFDAIIGNPPYVRFQALQETQPEGSHYFYTHYKAATQGNFDIYTCFIEKALTLLNQSGRAGYIVPHKFFNATYGEPVRKIIATGKNLSKIIHFGDNQIFPNATTYTCILLLTKKPQPEFYFHKPTLLEKWIRNENDDTGGTLPAPLPNAGVWTFSTNGMGALVEKLSQKQKKLGELTRIFVGVQTDADDVYIVEQRSETKDSIICFSKATGEEHAFEKTHLKRLLKGSLNIRRYYLDKVAKRLIFPYETADGKSAPISAKDYARTYPKTWAYLVKNKSTLAARNKGDTPDDWHGYIYKKNHMRFDGPKIVVPAIATGSCFAYDATGDCYFTGSGGGGGGGYGIVWNTETKLELLYLLGILNSKLISAILRTVSTPFRGGYIALNKQYIENLPIIIGSKTEQNLMIKLVTGILDLHERVQAAQTPDVQTRLQREITATDRQIDALVYQLYNLTESEIALVDQSTT